MAYAVATLPPSARVCSSICSKRRLRWFSSSLSSPFYHHAACRWCSRAPRVRRLLPLALRNVRPCGCCGGGGHCCCALWIPSSTHVIHLHAPLPLASRGRPARGGCRPLRAVVGVVAALRWLPRCTFTQPLVMFRRAGAAAGQSRVRLQASRLCARGDGDVHPRTSSSVFESQDRR
jgi:hypothetical protein